MRLRSFLPLLLLASCSCNRGNDEEVITFSSEEDSALAKIQTADSLYSVRHASYSGLHSHGDNAAVHAHQNIEKKRRILRNEAKNLDSRKRAYQKQNEKRMKKIREELNRTPENLLETLPADTSKKTENGN